ncbi:MAG: AsmA family protein [Xanthomonadaceae bacterium]|nr:AsmA family protein [Xanthomonadaceae bacterium]MDP2185214.1 AsmA family protein [Xanthomonadales bacterium]MDZ4116898.1 AsmA family protein [Xanthomonadaceae bacterium]MDZ4379507.1 AsmA family protein [Xanthomonadaceae bacterium]
MRRRSWLIVLVVVASLVVVAVWQIGRLLQPERLTPVLLNAIGDATGLELTVTEPADYALRPEPRLRLHGVRATAPGSAQVLLEIGLLDIALPWRTLLGGEPVITALYIKEARLHLLPMQSWLENREDTAPSTWPTLESGLQISNSTIIADGWQLQIDALGLPRFVPGQPAALTMSGHVLRSDAGGASDWPLHLSVDTVIAHDDATITLDPLQISLQAASPLATGHARGDLSIGEMMQFKLAGELAQWPAQWPTLPGTDPSLPMLFVVSGDGPELVQMLLAVKLEQAQTRLLLTLVPAQLQAWLDSDAASPLPPLSGELHTERMMIDGTELQGVEIRVEADAEP